MGLEGSKISWGKKNVSYDEIFTKNFLAQISSGNFGPDSPSRGNFQAQNFLERRGNFARKFLDHLIIELKSVHTTVFSVVLAHTCIESHKRCPKSLDERAWQHCYTRWNDDCFFLFSVRADHVGDD